MSNDTYQDGKHVVCVQGHVHHYSNLDKHGMDRFCPECFSRIEGGQVVAAQRGENQIDDRYVDTATEHSREE